ncbi:MAG: flavin reductase family protein [Flavobacteriaceae bacterium]|nr:flavin reductase family protein [Flavobacteriaceae bacterium]
MKLFTRSDIDQMDKIYRLNLINSVTGYKSANLLGTKSTTNQLNIAVFSSITHLGSNPPLVGFVLRPTTVPRDTYKNIKETGIFTVNHIHDSIIEDAHHTSAKYPTEISEFDQTELEPEFKGDFDAPYVKNARISLGCKFQNEYEIKENDTLLIVSEIVEIHIHDEALEDDGWVRLDKAKTVAINGLDGYALPNLLERFSYARPKK